MLNVNSRRMPVIEVYDKDKKFVGTFVNMNMVYHILPKTASFNFRFSYISENNKSFKEILRKGYIMNPPKLSVEEKRMLALDLKDPDAVVEYLFAYYSEQNIQTEEDLLKKLTKQKPLVTATKLQEKIH